MAQIDLDNLTPEQEKALLDKAASIRNERAKKENDAYNKRKAEEAAEAERKRIAAAEDKKKRFMERLQARYENNQTGYNIFDPAEWRIQALDDENEDSEFDPHPPQFEATIKPTQEYSSYREEYYYDGGAELDLDFDGLDDICKKIGVGQRVKITIEPLPPPTFEELQRLNWFEHWYKEEVE